MRSLHTLSSKLGINGGAWLNWMDRAMTKRLPLTLFEAYKTDLETTVDALFEKFDDAGGDRLSANLYLTLSATGLDGAEASETQLDIGYNDESDRNDVLSATEKYLEDSDAGESEFRVSFKLEDRAEGGVSVEDELDVSYEVVDGTGEAAANE
ncbi:MAG TPA: hypothetical protein VMU13_00840 [Candidatus Paceibacterota bacterium]|nr:hypothetical protein [Candidatus Paceibacterota bacterium]